MTSEGLRELADKLTDNNRPITIEAQERAAAYLRACADAMDAGPVAWVSHNGTLRERLSTQLADQQDMPLYPVAMPAQPVSVADESAANPWHAAIDNELVCCGILNSDNENDPRRALQNIINWHVQVALDPAVSSDAQALIERGRAALVNPEEDTAADLRELRDYFAAKAMQANLTVIREFPDEHWREGLAHDAYRMADAMLRVREANNG